MEFNDKSKVALREWLLDFEATPIELTDTAQNLIKVLTRSLSGEVAVSDVSLITDHALGHLGMSTNQDNDPITLEAKHLLKDINQHFQIHTSDGMTMLAKRPLSPLGH